MLQGDSILHKKIFSLHRNSFWRHVWRMNFHANSGNSVERLRMRFKVLNEIIFNLKSSADKVPNCKLPKRHVSYTKPVNKLAKALPLPPTYEAAWFKIKYLSFVPARWTIRFLKCVSCCTLWSDLPVHTRPQKLCLQPRHIPPLNGALSTTSQGYN